MACIWGKPISKTMDDRGVFENVFVFGAISGAENDSLHLNLQDFQVS